MYAVTSTPVVNLTLATFLNAELGFLGVEVYTRVHTPLFWGAPFSAGVVVFFFDLFLPFLTNWLMVGIFASSCYKFFMKYFRKSLKYEFVYVCYGIVKLFM